MRELENLQAAAVQIEPETSSRAPRVQAVVQTEGAGSSETNTNVPANNHSNKMNRKATSVAKIRTVNGKRIGSKRGTAKGMSKKRLTKLLEEQIARDKKQIEMAQEALKQSIPVPEPIPITQEDEPIEMPQQQEQPVIPEQQEIQEPPIQQLRRSKRLEEVEQPMYMYYQRPPNVANIRQEALYHVMGKVLFDSSEASIPDHLINNKMNISPAIDLEALQQSNLNVGSEVDLDELCNGVVHPITKETITKYQKLIEDPMLRDDWIEAMCKELGRLAQGYNDTAGTDTIRFLTHEEIRCIPADRTVTYARIVVDYRPQKEDKNRVRITVGGNLIDYPYELTTRTADLTTTKLMWNSVISTPGAKYACGDIGNMYLETPLDMPEYMRMAINSISRKPLLISMT